MGCTEGSQGAMVTACTEESALWIYGKNFYCESGQALEEVTQTGCGIFLYEQFQNSSGQGPQQPDITLELALL